MSESAPQIVAALIARGFTVLDQVEELGNGKPQPGLPIKGVTYMSRTISVASHPAQTKTFSHPTHQQYVSVIAKPWETDFHLQSCVEEYHVPKARTTAPGGMDSHTRMERGFSPVYCNSQWDLAALLVEIEASHPLPPRPPKRS